MSWRVTDFSQADLSDFRWFNQFVGQSQQFLGGFLLQTLFVTAWDLLQFNDLSVEFVQVLFWHVVLLFDYLWYFLWQLGETEGQFVFTSDAVLLGQFVGDAQGDGIGGCELGWGSVPLGWILDWYAVFGDVSNWNWDSVQDGGTASAAGNWGGSGDSASAGVLASASWWRWWWDESWLNDGFGASAWSWQWDCGQGWGFGKDLRTDYHGTLGWWCAARVLSRSEGETCLSAWVATS